MTKSVGRDALLARLDGLLAPELFKDYCPNGLQVEGKEEISSVGVAVSASLSTIEAACEAGVDALFVHHGLFWKGDDYRVVGTKQKKLRLLMEAGISLFAYHLPLDAHNKVGNNWRVAADLNWSACEPFGEYNGTHIGVIGTIESRTAVQFATELEQYYEHPAHYAPGGDGQISRVALISGGAHKAIEEAARMGADAFITGSFDEPIWHLAAEERVHFYAMGHAATERIGPRAIGEYLTSELGLSTQFIEIPNPF